MKRANSRTRLLVSTLATVLLSAALTTPQAFADEQAPVTSRRVAEPVHMSEGEYRKLKAAGTLDASDWTVAAEPSAQGKPLTEAQANAELARAATAGAAAPEYGDTSKVPLQERSGELTAAAAAAAPPTSWGDTPPQDAETCLGRNEANQAGGLTFNRWVWCHRMRIGLNYYEVDEDGRELEGTNSLVAEVAAVGSGTERGIRTYLRVEEGSVSYDGWDPLDRWFTAPDLHMYVLSDCAQGYDYCQGTGSGVEHTWERWDHLGAWLHWDIYSHEEASTAADKVLYHDWFFRYGGGDEDEYPGPEGRTPYWQIRCDSANYFERFGREYPRACVNYNVVPHLTYRISDTRVEDVARHIRFAQNEPTRTYPVEFTEVKDIPGKYTGVRDGRGLTRTPHEGPVDKANEDVKDRACQRKPPYEGDWGLPPYDTGTHQCDEYPFSITNEGASHPEWAFSVRAVPSAQNGSAGGLLNWYLFSDRILYDRDPFWVEILD
ncbi:NucA/NucB deoxyribonuclease domain-containing protein [Streptomyces sp. NPDC052701]|uniref:NucA/NucB deoxyribonuclease domain-containing protein n=1 Tax=Streptomyces sp. NPDC052701 TaxID=3155533 RepID=UPI003429B8AE